MLLLPAILLYLRLLLLRLKANEASPRAPVKAHRIRLLVIIIDVAFTRLRYVIGVIITLTIVGVGTHHPGATRTAVIPPVMVITVAAAAHLLLFVTVMTVLHDVWVERGLGL